MLTRRRVVPVSIAAVALLAAFDHVTGVETTFVVLTYLLPIAGATWYHSRGAGIALAVISTAATVGIFIDTHEAARTSATTVNGIGAFGMYMAAVFLLGALHDRVERERAQRRLAVEQLRHAERLNVIGTLAAGVAHEIGTPLNVISGAAEILAEDPITATKAGELSQLILNQTEKITAIIKHLLEFGRRGGTATTEVDVDGTIARTVDLLAATARKRMVDIRFSGSLGGEHRVRGSARELEQVISNLALNGIHAMPRGGTLRIATRIEDRGGHAFAAIVVEDAGCGIREKDLPFIFDPFFTTKGVGEGTGLGLSVSYGIVQDWGGTFEVTSTPGRGTTFVVLLPLATQPGAQVMRAARHVACIASDA
jgi:signal transduction histidine kinase